MKHLSTQELGIVAITVACLIISAVAVFHSLTPLKKRAHPPVPMLGGTNLQYLATLKTSVAPGGIKIHNFDAAETAKGISLEPDIHNYFTCSEGGTVDIDRSAFSNDRFWIYEFNGNEPQHFDGDFLISEGELDHNPQYASIDTLRSLKPQKLYYVMTSVQLETECGSGIWAASICGDGICAETEDINNCTEDCSFCGDGIKVEREECDDSNTAPGDGCSQSCTIEVGYTCDENDRRSTCSLIIPELREASSDEEIPADYQCLPCRDTCVKVEDGHDALTCGDATVSCEKNLEAASGCDVIQEEREEEREEEEAAEREEEEPEEREEEEPEESNEGEESEEETHSIRIDTVENTTEDDIPVGTLFVYEHPTSLQEQFMLAGTLSDPVLELTFMANDTEDIDVQNIRFANVRRGTSAVQSIEHLELYRNDEATPFATAREAFCDSAPTPSNVSANARFCAALNGDLIVEKGEKVDVRIRVQLKSEEEGAIAGEEIEIMLPQNADWSVTAEGVSSTTALQPNNGDTEAEEEVILNEKPGPNKEASGRWGKVVMSTITSITNANPDPHGSPIPTGTAPFGQFAFTAAAHKNAKNGLNDVILDSLLFTVNATNAVLDAQSFVLYNREDPVHFKPCQARYLTGEEFTATNVSGEFLVECSGLPSSPVVSTIAPGTSKVVVLAGSVINPSLNPATSSILQASLQSLTDRSQHTFAHDGTHVIWKDKDATSEQQLHWMDLEDTVIRSTNYTH